MSWQLNDIKRNIIINAHICDHSTITLTEQKKNESEIAIENQILLKLFIYELIYSREYFGLLFGYQMW